MRQITEARAATLETVAGLDEPRARRPAADGGWSVSQVVDHLIRTDEVYRSQIGRLFERKNAGGDLVLEVGLKELNTRPPFVPAAALPYLDLPFRLINRMVPAALREYLTRVAVIPFEAPDAAAPQPHGGIDELRLRLRASGEATVALLADRDVSGLILDHPMLGRNDVPALLRILARHEERHRGQIARVLAEGPAAGEARASAPGAPEQPASGAADARLQAFAADAEKALRTGREIVEWWRTKALENALELFPLKPAYPPYYEMQAFFDEILFLGQMKPISIMGCLQRNRFKRRRPPTGDAGAHLESFIDERFLEKSLRYHPGGEAGGFRYRPICFKEKGGRLVEPADREALGADLAAFRNGLEWGVLQVDILDFVRVNKTLEPYNKTLSRFIRESAYVVIHEDLAREITKAPKGVMAERRFGYAFLPREVESNLFGFGPGKFGAAIKQWRFLLYLNGDVEVEVAFLVAPRSQKVLDVAGFDPVYASVGMVDLMSLGVFGLRESAHAALDRVFLEHHGTVHADVVLGMADVWEGQRWTPSFGSW
ncbi:MAG: DinB family protein [Vicinamibacteria bacterium]